MQCQNKVPNPNKTQSSSQPGKCTDKLRNCNHDFHRRESSNSGHIFATRRGWLLLFGFWLFCLVFFFLNPFSKLVASLCSISVVMLDHYSNFKRTQNTTGPNQGGFNAHHWLSQSWRHSKVPENISKYTDLLNRTTWKTTPQAVCWLWSPPKHIHL